MAWSDRVMARSLPSQPQMRVVVGSRRPDRTVRRASGTPRSGSSSFAQLTEPSDAAPQSAETVHVQAAQPEPVQPIPERSFPAAEIVTARPVAADGATNDSPGTRPVSATGFVSAMQDTGTISHVTRGLDGRFGVELGLALCAVLSLLSGWWLQAQGGRLRTRSAKHFLTLVSRDFSSSSFAWSVTSKACCSGQSVRDGNDSFPDARFETGRLAGADLSAIDATHAGAAHFGDDGPRWRPRRGRRPLSRSA